MIRGQKPLAASQMALIHQRSAMDPAPIRR